MITDKIEKNKFLLIAGPCAIEGRDIAFGIAERLLDITSKLSIPLVFKGSYRKANRTRLDRQQDQTLILLAIDFSHL